jgi:hypothetical protein
MCQRQCVILLPQYYVPLRGNIGAGCLASKLGQNNGSCCSLRPAQLMLSDALQLPAACAAAVAAAAAAVRCFERHLGNVGECLLHDNSKGIWLLRGGRDWCAKGSLHAEQALMSHVLLALLTRLLCCM